MVKHQALIRDKQTTFKRPPPYASQKSTLHIPLKTIPEVSNEGASSSQWTMAQKAMEESEEQIPALEQETANDLWEEVCNFKEREAMSVKSTPFSTI